MSALIVIAVQELLGLQMISFPNLYSPEASIIIPSAGIFVIRYSFSELGAFIEPKFEFTLLRFDKSSVLRFLTPNLKMKKNHVKICF